MKQTPTKPGKAYARLILDLVQSGRGKSKLDPRPEEIDVVARVFTRAGGSWERLFRGSIDDMTLLKKTVRVAVERGMFTSSSQW